MAYTVYCHLFPNGKTYIGATRQKPQKRWHYGTGYVGAYVHKAIIEFGWDNIKHIILASGVDKDTAYLLERYYIEVYRSNNRRYGYNVSSGGECSATGVEFSKERKQDIVNEMNRLWNDPAYRKHMSEVHKGHSPSNKGKPLPEWQKEYLRKINTGKKQSPESIAKRVAKMKGRKLSPEHCEKISECHKGVPLTEEHKAKLRQGWIHRKIMYWCAI